MGKKLLTIVISTYNRKELLEKNLSKLLSYNLKEIEFIIGDNASTDNTWDMLQRYSNSSNVKLSHNKENIGTFNFILLSFDVRTPFFLWLNDRDYIEENDLRELLEVIRVNQNCEMIASVRMGRFTREGYYYNTRFSLFYDLAEHPGNIVYKAEYVKKNLDYKLIKNYTDEGKVIEGSCYVRTQLQYFLNIGYYRPINCISQPRDRDKNVPQVRKEMYGVSYILPEFQISDFDALISFSEGYEDKKKIAEILMARYRISLLKLELEFHDSVAIADFRLRNHCEDAKPSYWLRNGFQYTKAVLRNDLIRQYNIGNKIKIIFIADTLFMCVRLVARKVKRIIKCGTKQ